MSESINQLKAIFPDSETRDIEPAVESELRRGEHLIWIGGPSRWGLFRATPFVLILIGAIGYLTYLGAASDATAWQYLMMMAESQSGSDALILPGLAAGYLIILGLAMRDPRQRWIYVVTDRRLMTFYKNRALRSLSAERVHLLTVLKGLEGQLRGIGDVVWSRGSGHEAGERGPDQGRHGFRGMRQPERWKERLHDWAAALGRQAAGDAAKFVESVANNSAKARSSSGNRQLENPRYGFAITLPEHWVGRIGLRERAPFRILGLEMPFKQLLTKSDEPLHQAPDAWNFITVSGRAGLKFNLNVNDGPAVAAFETSRDKVGKSLIDADGDLRCGPLSGYRVDYIYLDKLHCRFAMLAGDGFHVLINVTLPPDQVDDLLPALDAVFGSIRAV